jgi:hypothetical protein
VGFFALMSRLISIVGFNEKEKAMPNGHWEIIPGEFELVHHDERALTPYGLQGRVYDQWEPKKKWVEDFPSWGNSGYTPPGQGYSEEPPRQSSIFDSIIIEILAGLVLSVLFILALVVFSSWVQNNVPKDALSAGSTWDGYEYQDKWYYDGHWHAYETTMILTINSIKKGSFYGTVRWPNEFTVTKTVGTIITNANHTKDARWKWVTPPCSNGIYLQLTETEEVQGNTGLLNVKYYGVFCDDRISGVWFYPDRPYDGPGGEFSIKRRSP